ncbi:MAG: hypothetical protein JNJ54_08920 [Myxococcaceae bacterium]|nr:hypothetical protein [Myxococcaceae bacterium]
MTLGVGEPLGDGWVLERVSAGAVRFVRAPSVDRRRALSRLVVAFGSLAVALSLLAVSVQSAEALWLITWTLIALFGLTSGLALLSAVKDLRRSLLGVFLEVTAQQVTGVIDGQGFTGQFSVATVALPRARTTLTLEPLEGGSGGAMLVVRSEDGTRLLAPDFPGLAEARALLARVGA